MTVSATAVKDSVQGSMKDMIKDTSSKLPKKLQGREFYKSIGSPKTIVGPMVDQSELAWRILSRRYGADLCYSPMYHARLFATEKAYRDRMISELDGDPTVDRPLVIQFCANDPEYLLQAAKLVEDKCDAVDLNLGCPQGIARKGHYGSFLMEDWDLVHKLINNLHKNLSIPVTTKIRVYDDWEKSVDYAKMVIDAGAQFLTVHGRTRDMKGQATGLANWEILKHIKERVEDQVFFANGNIIYPDDIERCFQTVDCDAVMSAEGNLYNPGTLWTKDNDIEKQFPRVDKLLREYFEIVRSINSEASRHCMKAHFFKILHEFLNHNTDLRPLIGRTSVNSDWKEWDDIVKEIENRVEKIYEDKDIKDVVTVGELESWGGKYREVPYWRCQPYFRRVNGEKQNTRVLKIAASDKLSVPVEESKKRKAESETDQNKRVQPSNE